MDYITPLKCLGGYLVVLFAIHFALYIWTCSITSAYYYTVRKMFKSELEKRTTTDISNEGGGCNCG